MLHSCLLFLSTSCESRLSTCPSPLMFPASPNKLSASECQGMHKRGQNDGHAEDAAGLLHLHVEVEEGAGWRGLKCLLAIFVSWEQSLIINLTVLLLQLMDREHNDRATPSGMHRTAGYFLAANWWRVNTSGELFYWVWLYSFDHKINIYIH